MIELNGWDFSEMEKIGYKCTASDRKGYFLIFQKPFGLYNKCLQIQIGENFEIEKLYWPDYYGTAFTAEEFHACDKIVKDLESGKALPLEIKYISAIKKKKGYQLEEFNTAKEAENYISEYIENLTEDERRLFEACIVDIERKNIDAESLNNASDFTGRTLKIRWKNGEKVN